jgi:FG-GAP-like repeat
MAPKWLALSALGSLLVALAPSCGGDGGDDANAGPGPFHGKTADRDPDDPTLPRAPTCEPAASPAGMVAAPTLRMTLPGSWDENWFASPALVDVDGDGNRDIVAARHSVLYVWRHDGTLLWQTAFPQSAANSDEHGSSRMYASAVVGDMDGDGDVEIAVGSDADGQHNRNLAVYDHRGALLDGWPIVFGDSEVRAIAGADIDGDGIVEILVNKTNQGPATAVYELDGTFHPGWPQVDGSCDPPEPAESCWDFGGYNQNIGAGDVDGDGVMDVISSYDAIGFGVFSGEGVPFPTHGSFADRVITSVEAYHELELSQQGWGTGDRSEFTYSPPVIADIDGDGDLEYILAGDHEHSEDTSNQGVTVWVLNHDMTRPPGWDPPKDTGAPIGADDKGANIVRLTPAPAVANIDGTPGLEIVVPTYDGRVHAFATDGSELWTYDFTSADAPYTGASEALIVDLDGDATPEIIFTTYTSGPAGEPDAPAHLIVLSAAGDELHRIPLHARGSMAAPAVADLDGDGQLELVISLKDSLGGGESGVQIWDLPGASDNCVLWATGRGHPLRWGYVPPG